MGAWGAGVFENDTACDFASEVAEGGGMGALSGALDRVISSGANYLDAAEAQEALAAAEIVARLKGRPGGQTAYPDAIDVWIDSLQTHVPVDLVEKGRRSVGRILVEPSELLDLWSASKDFDSWKLCVEGVLLRLELTRGGAVSSCSTTKTKRHRRKVGDVYEIDLGDGTHAYAREATFSSTAIYDSRTALDLAIDEVVGFPVLFFVCVLDAIELGEWKIVGNRSLADVPLPEIPPKGIKDPHDKNVFRIYFHSGQIRTATREEIKGLEPAMLWRPDAVKKRLLDYYNGFPDRWKELIPSYYFAD